MFKNWFKKKRKEATKPSTEEILEKGEQILATEDGKSYYKVIRNISDDVTSKLEASTLLLRFSDVFMHYWDGATPEDHNNPEWQNQGLFFWLADEEFPRKSLPPVFEKMEKKFFLIQKQVSIFRVTVIPWFGMPGGGTKMAFGNTDQPTPIKDIKEQGYIQYIEIVELANNNTDILSDRENYIILVNTNIKFENNSFCLNGTPISLTQAYMIGLINIAKFI